MTSAARRRRRTPFVFQMTAAECGLAGLVMIARAHRRPATLSGLRRVLEVGGDGVSALALVRAGRAVGLTGRAVACPPAALAGLPLPAMVLWRGNHFVVVDRFRRHRGQVLDPAHGRRWLTMAEIADGYQGVALLYEPDPAASFTPVPEPSSWPFLRPSVRRAAALLGVLGLVTLAAHLLTLVSPFLIGRALDRGTSARPLGADLVAAALAAVVGSYLISAARSAVAIRLQRRLDGDLAPGFFGHLIRLPHPELERRGTGDLMGRMESLTLARLALTSQAVTTVLDTALALVAVSVLLLRSVPLGGVVLVAVVAQVAPLVWLTGRLHEATIQAAVCEGAVHGFTAESLQGIATLKSLGAEDAAQRRFADLATERRAAESRRDRLAGRLEAVLVAVQIATPLAVLVGAYSAMAAGRQQVGDLVVSVGLAAAAVSPAASMVSGVRAVQAARSHLTRLADVWGIEAEPDAEPVTLAGAIDLDGVGVRYPGREQWAVRDVRVRIEPGEHLAIVGRSGSGKSTLAKVVAGLHRPTEGRIRYDGRDSAELGGRALRRAMGVVLQDIWLFSGTVEENIRVDRDITRRQMRQACRRAAIHDTIRSLPLGYASRLGDGGGGLSGGQRQRIALARALAHQPAVVVLDEATSHLDPAGEVHVARELAALGVTRVTVAHRLSTVRRADRILVLDGGRVAQIGTYDELAAVPGPFRELLTLDEAVPAAVPGAGAVLHSA